MSCINVSQKYLSFNLKVSNSDGRAGMAAVAGEIDIEHLAKVNLDLTSSS